MDDYITKFELIENELFVWTWNCWRLKLDKKTGKVVWEYQLPAGGFATPITYMINGRQYITIAVGGGRGLKAGGMYMAFALPGK